MFHTHVQTQYYTRPHVHTAACGGRFVKFRTMFLFLFNSEIRALRIGPDINGNTAIVTIVVIFLGGVGVCRILLLRVRVFTHVFILIIKKSDVPFLSCLILFCFLSLVVQTTGTLPSMPT